MSMLNTFIAACSTLIMMTESRKRTKSPPACTRHELDANLPQHMALGYRIYISGIRPKTLCIWCEMCCAYSGSRLQKLDMQCEGWATHTRPIKRCHLISNIALDTSSRRVTVRNICLSHRWGLFGRRSAQFVVRVLEQQKRV